jgi:hypothetical protein
MREENELWRSKMKISTKLGILVTAIVISLIGFNLIASTSVSMLKVARAADYEMIGNYLARVNSTSGSYQPYLASP